MIKDITGIFGLVLIGAGTYLIYPALCLITVGSILLSLSVWSITRDTETIILTKRVKKNAPGAPK